MRTFLHSFYTGEVVDERQAAERIVGQWLSRVQGFHDEQDFTQLVQAFTGYLWAPQVKSRENLALGYFFGGFMPTYGAAFTFVSLLFDGEPWPRIQAFMHSLSYGAARTYVEQFDWAGARKKARAEVTQWIDILRAEAHQVETAQHRKNQALMGFVGPYPGSPTPTPTAPPAVAPAPLPEAAPAAGALERLLGGTVRFSPWLVALSLMLYSSPLNEGEDEELRRMRLEQAEKNDTLVVPWTDVQTEITTNATNPECQPQQEDNNRNGRHCEENAHGIMETALAYATLAAPPGGPGLDGLFEKRAPMNLPAPFPSFVQTPRPGKLLFLPPGSAPPKAIYDYAGEPKTATYPKFVVLEAKHIGRPMDPEGNPDGFQRGARHRLKNTCGGRQMSEAWVEDRIAPALEKNGMSGAKIESKESEIRKTGFARWVFVCQPGATESARTFVFIDIGSSDIMKKIDQTKPKVRKPHGGQTQAPSTDTGY
ncbi:MAG: hypothetical protein P8014_13505 [Acidihalobacter sp.]|uniref:hypothetical protein n=1 Tax=Acidihalobacter sp. TaxID=1872108 RepID=UPI00307E8EE6